MLCFIFVDAQICFKLKAYIVHISISIIIVSHILSNSDICSLLDDLYELFSLHIK